MCCRVFVRPLQARSRTGVRGMAASGALLEAMNWQGTSENTPERNPSNAASVTGDRECVCDRTQCFKHRFWAIRNHYVFFQMFLSFWSSGPSHEATHLNESEGRTLWYSTRMNRMCVRVPETSAAGFLCIHWVSVLHRLANYMLSAKG